VAGAVIGCGSLAVVRVASHRHASDYGAVLRSVAGPVLGLGFDSLATGFLLLTASVTLAGGGALLHDFYALPLPIGLAVTAALACLLVVRGQASVFAASTVLVPALVVALLAVALASTTLPPPGDLPMPPEGVRVRPPGRPTADHGAPGRPPRAGPLAAVAAGSLYGSYNLILGMGVVVAAARHRTAGAVRAGCAAGSLAFAAIAWSVLDACGRGGRAVLGAAVPVAALARAISNAALHAYAAALGLAVLTTLAAVALSLADRWPRRGPGRPSLAAPAVIWLAVLPAWVGFARLVRTLYPAMGLLGLGWLALLFLDPAGQERTARKPTTRA
jgi:uncharacterized membrane protein YkvI